MGKRPFRWNGWPGHWSAAACKVKRGGLVELDDVGGSMAFVKRKNKHGKLVDTLTFSNEDEIANDYKIDPEVVRHGFL
jgi:hypothetical protein